MFFKLLHYFPQTIKLTVVFCVFYFSADINAQTLVFPDQAFEVAHVRLVGSMAINGDKALDDLIEQTADACKMMVGHAAVSTVPKGEHVATHVVDDYYASWGRIRQIKTKRYVFNKNCTVTPEDEFEVELVRWQGLPGKDAVCRINTKNKTATGTSGVCRMPFKIYEQGMRVFSASVKETGDYETVAGAKCSVMGQKIGDVIESQWCILKNPQSLSYSHNLPGIILSANQFHHKPEYLHIYNLKADFFDPSERVTLKQLLPHLSGGYKVLD
jgi:hypothetical protein